MYKYGNKSINNLKECHTDLQILFNEVLKIIDHSIVCGFRGKKEQDKAFESGNSKVKFPHGKHNSFPSNAVDAYPYPIDYKDKERIIYFAGIVMGVAEKLYEAGKITHKIKWGGDWNGDNDLKDGWDWGHFELIF